MSKVISMHEAMEALNEGKKVRFHYWEGTNKTSKVFGLNERLTGLDDFTWCDLINLNWSIEDVTDDE